MKKIWSSIRHGFIRVSPLLVAGAGAVVASGSFRHYVAAHPQVATVVPVVVWLIHAFAHAKQTPAAS